MGIDVFTLNKAKRYTNLVALGLASATVDDVNKSITFTLASDGSQHTIHFSQPSDGKDGISVTGISDKGNGVFTLLFSDGSESDPIQCVKGEDGVSPTATVEKVGKVATITITDKNGTTTTTIKDGEGSEGGETNTIDSISVNGVNVVPDENKNVDITVPDAYDDTDIRAELENKADTDHTHTTVNGHTVESDVPVDAKFTDTVYDDAQIKTQIQAVANGLMDSVGYSADYKTIDIIAKNGVKKSVNVAPIISHASITELSDVDTTNKATGKALVYNATTSKHEYADVSGTDEKVKMNASTDAKYLGELLDNITIANENGELKVKKLDGQEVTITEINYLKGLTMNVMDLVNMFSNGGVKIINTPVATYAELLTIDKSSFIDGISYLVYVLADENYDNAKTTYLVDKVSATPTYFGFADSNRDFTSNPIDLATEITGKLGIANMDSDAIKALFTVDDTYKTATATNNAFSTHGAKALYDELLLVIGNKANDSDLTTHKDDVNIHVSEEDRTKWDSAKTHADSAHAPSNAQENVIETVKVNGIALTQDENKNVNIDLSDYAKTTDIPTTLPANGGNADTVNNHTVKSDVPENAVFTDTIYDDTEVKGSIKELSSNLDTLAYGENAGGKNLIFTDELVGKKLSITQDIGGIAPNGDTITFSISTTTNDDMDNSKSVLYIMRTDGTNSTPVNNGQTLTLTDDDKNNFLGYRVNVIPSLEGKIVKSIQVEVGTTATPYEPYIPSVKMIAEENAQQSSDLDGLGYGENGAKNLFKDYDVMQSYTISSETYNGYPVIYSDQQWEGAYQSDLILKSGVTYTISAYVKGNGYAYVFSSSKGGYIGGKKIALTDNFKRFSLVYTPNEDVSQIRIENEGSGLYIACFQIEEGCTATPYKPYIPSVKMLAEEVSAQNDSLSVIGKCKNLLNPTLETTTVSGVTCTNNGDGTYTINGTASADAVFELESYKPYTGNEIFRLVGCPSGGSASTYYLGFRPRDAEENRKDIGSGVTFNDLSTSNVYAVAIIVLNGTTVTNLTFKPMLTENLNATYDDFAPYTGDGETLTHDVAKLNENLGAYNINENATSSYSKSNGFAIEWLKMCKATKGTYKLSYTINGSTGSSSEIALGKSINDKTLYRNIGLISDGIYEQIIDITSDTDIYIMVYTNGSITISNIKFTLQNIANEVGNLKNDLVPKKIELQNVDERVTIRDNGSFIINGFAFVNLLVTFNETLQQWSNFVRLPRPKDGNVTVYCENSVKLTIYSQDNLPGDCGTYDIVQSGTEIRLLVNYEVA